MLIQQDKVIPISALECVRDRETLFAFLRDQLNWPVDPEDTFTYRGPQVADELATRVVVSQIVPFATNDPFIIMLAEFRTPFKRVELRSILQAIRKEMRTRAAHNQRPLEEIVFICTTDNYREIRFAHFKEISGRQPRLSMFRWERDRLHETRTLRGVNLPALFLPRTTEDKIDWQTAGPRWHDAWDVDSVTDTFFKEFHQTFDKIKEKIAAVSKSVDPKIIHTFTLTLMNRLLFCWFIQQKNWLSHEPAYLLKQWEMQRQREGAGFAGTGSFYDEILRPLFFLMLNTPRETRVDQFPEIVERMGDFPYLNGGLFEENLIDKLADPSIASRGIHVPNAAMELLFSQIEDTDRRPRGLFLRWHFTIEESMPDDIEVAVDPEMLGKVFEELMNELTAEPTEETPAGGKRKETKRHATGAYYTPRPIVSFMCKEALKGYLLGPPASLPASSSSEAPAAITRFVDDYDADGLHNPEAILSKLQHVRVCDPACGSGAYLLGMLQELLRLRRALFAAKHIDSNSDYIRKQEIIRQCLYGVDIEPTAVEIARLRLWLSLAVDFYDGGYLASVPALPNLDFLIEPGDSVTTPSPETGQFVLNREHIINYANLKRRETACTDQVEKTLLREEIAKAKEAIRRDLGIQESLPFDWRVDFAEVFNSVSEPSATMAGNFAFANEVDRQTTLLQPEFAQPVNGGFDIILANPPYVRQELIKEQKPALKRVYDDLFCGTADLYVFFYYRALQLLKPDGVLIFISSNKWLRAGYGAKLRAHFASTARVWSIIDFGDLPVFQTALTYPMIIVAQKGAGRTTTHFTEVVSLADPYPDVRMLIDQHGYALAEDALVGETWRLINARKASFLKKVGTSGKPLGEYINGQIYRGILTGFNTAFIIDGAKRAELIADDPKSAEIIKPLIMGRDIRKWAIDRDEHWLIVTPIGINIKRYPAIFAHMSQWQCELEARYDKGNYWWELRACDYYGIFDQTKIVYQEIATYQAFALDTAGSMTNNKAFMIPSSNLFLLGVLNSETAWQYLDNTCSKLQGGAFAMQTPYISKLPIPDAPEAECSAISALVQKSLDAHGIDCEVWEAEINERVARLYGV